MTKKLFWANRLPIDLETNQIDQLSQSFAELDPAQPQLVLFCHLFVDSYSYIKIQNELR